MSTVLPFHDNDLAQLPAPTVINETEFDTLFSHRKTAYNGLTPLLLNDDNQPVSQPAQLIETTSETYWKIPVDPSMGLYYVDLPSDPVNRLIAVDTYRELQQISRINHTALATMPAYASGSNLEHIASRYGVFRLTVTEATDSTPEVLESDRALRRRMMLVIEGYARGGSIGWYLFNALSASGKVKDASVISPDPCHITITLLSHDGDGTADAELVQVVDDYIKSRHTRVLGDLITVQAAEVVHYTITATVSLYPGPGAASTIDAIHTEFASYREQSEKIGHIIAQSAIDQALHRPGVYRALVQSPALPILIEPHQAPFCDELIVTEVAQ